MALHTRCPQPPTRRSQNPRRQRGAALLIALLTVTLIATFSATALWKQWRATEIEAAERSRLQAAWVLVAALDWARLILREDAVADQRLSVKADHLGEPWSVPLEEVQLRDFLSAENNVAAEDLEGLPEAYLSGRIVDAQSKLNLRNLISSGQAMPQTVAAFEKLFVLLSLPPDQVKLIVQGLQQAWPATATQAAQEQQSGDGSSTPSAQANATVNTQALSATTPRTLTPTRVQDLIWFGVPLSTVHALLPHVTLLPKPTTINLNTASAEVLAASSDKLDLAGAQRLVSHRQRSFFTSVADANQLLPSSNVQLNGALHGVSTQYFEVHGRLRLDRLWVNEQSLLLRNGNQMQVLWRERGTGLEAPSS